MNKAFVGMKWMPIQATNCQIQAFGLLVADHSCSAFRKKNFLLLSSPLLVSPKFRFLTCLTYAGHLFEVIDFAIAFGISLLIK